MAHSSSARPRPWSSQRQHEALASVRSPSVRAAPTKDLQTELNRRRAGEDAPVSLERSSELRAELNRMRAGEDARVSLERARERRQNVEGRNLDYDFAAVALQTPTSARIQAGVPLAGVGCAVLADISAWRLGHPSSSHTCRRSTTVCQIRRNSCRYTSPLLRQCLHLLLHQNTHL
jgi:hypothetical protein